MAKLVIEAEDGGRRELELTTKPVRIGRASENDLALPDPTKGVSRMHAELRYEDGRYVILDLNSQNGTWLDGHRVQRADLASGSQIAIGSYLLTLKGADIRPALADAASNEPAAVVVQAAEPPVKAVEPPLNAEPEIEAVEPEVKAAASEVNAVVPEMKAAEPDVKAAEPEVKATEPEVKAIEPEVKVAAPEVRAAEPEVKAVEPEVKVAEPEVRAAEPVEKTVALEVKAVAPEVKVAAPAMQAATPSAAPKTNADERAAIAKRIPAVAAKAATSHADEEVAAEPVAKPRSVKEPPPFPIEELPLRLDEPPQPSDEAPSLLIKPSASPRATRPTPASAAAPALKKEAPKRPVRPPTIAPVEPEPGAFARFGKPVLLVVLIAIALAIAAGQRYLFAPAPPAATTAPPETNAQAIERHLAEGKALVEKKEYEAAIRDHFDRILLIDPNHAEATELKTKAQEAFQAQAATTPTDTAAAPPTNSAPSATAPPGASAPGAPAASQPQTPAVTAPAAPPKPVAAAPSTPPPDRGASTARGGTPGAGRAAENLPSPRRQNETVQAWRARNAELQAQYNTAKTAFDRRQYSAAVNGFEAVVKGEPNFLDAPQLLTKARAELKVTGPEALAAANKADAAGNWTVAVEQYQRARQLDSSLAPQADEGIRRVREKMRTAGAEAFKRARQLDALGRSADAIKEYENAAQWLPADDANRAVARQRADQLKTGLK